MIISGCVHVCKVRVCAWAVREKRVFSCYFPRTTRNATCVCLSVTDNIGRTAATTIKTEDFSLALSLPLMSLMCHAMLCVCCSSCIHSATRQFMWVLRTWEYAMVFHGSGNCHCSKWVKIKIEKQEEKRWNYVRYSLRSCAAFPQFLAQIVVHTHRAHRTHVDGKSGKNLT